MCDLQFQNHCPNPVSSSRCMLGCSCRISRTQPRTCTQPGPFLPSFPTAHRITYTSYLCTYCVHTNTLHTCSQNSAHRGPVDPHARSLHGPREPPSLTSPLKTRSASPATSPTTPLTMAEGSLYPSPRTQWRSSACPTPTPCRSPR
jgi:hypothetical protein